MSPLRMKGEIIVFRKLVELIAHWEGVILVEDVEIFAKEREGK